MKANNKNRLLQLIKILQNYTDMNHKLSLNEITSKLEENGIKINNRKTLYDDFKVLAENDYEVEYDNGYYLTEAPFSLSEVKIILDSISSLKNLDTKFLEKLNEKLYSFISIYEKDLLETLNYQNKHSDKKFINRLEDTLEAIRSNLSLIIKRNNKDEEEIAPIFLYRNNDFYYLYYHYLGNDKIYHFRFDNIVTMKLGKKENDITITRNKILNHIMESSNSFYSNKSELIQIEIINNSEYLKSRLLDDFNNIVFTNKGFSIKASINEAFFAKLTTYGADIKISDKNIAKDYIKFLNKIITQNK